MRPARRRRSPRPPRRRRRRRRSRRAAVNPQVLDQYPVLKRAVANQYQVILAAAATALSVATISPLPFLFERLKRRLEIEKKYAARQTESLSQAERYDQLAPEGKARFDGLQRLC